MNGSGEHRDAVYFDEEHSNDDRVKAAYRELRLWQKGYIAALSGGLSWPEEKANAFVAHVNAKRAKLLA